MKRRLATESWWIASMSLLVVSDLALVYWALADKFGWENGSTFGDFLFWITFFPGLFVAPVSALLGFNTSLAFLKTGQWIRSIVLAFLSGGAALCALIAWQAFIGHRG